MAAVSRPAPVVLVVLDGWGYRPEREGNAIAMAKVPTWDRLWARAPRTLLQASGEAVGLPCGQIGNSEVGHLNLGAGRVVKQDLVRISQAIADGSFFTNQVFVDACRSVRENGGTLHLVGLIGTGGVHAIDTHLYALLDLAERERVPRIAVQVMLDGRDTMPRSGLGFLQELITRIRGRAVIGSVGGRYFGMDRDHRWDRTEKWYRSAVIGAPPAAAVRPFRPRTRPPRDCPLFRSGELKGTVPFRWVGRLWGAMTVAASILLPAVSGGSVFVLIDGWQPREE